MATLEELLAAYNKDSSRENKLGELQARQMADSLAAAPGHDDSKGFTQNLSDYMGSPEHIKGMGQAANKTQEAAMTGGVGMGNLSKVAFNPEVRAIAQSYAKKMGMPLEHSASSPEVIPEFSKKIADAFENMKHDPNNPEVKAAYDALKKELLEQYKHLTDSGLKASPIKPGMENPYKTSKDMISDVSKNKHLYYYPSEQGFGSTAKITNHPLLEKSGQKIGDDELLHNDLFRIVHDYMGHAKEGKSFGPRGEEAAWMEHMKTFSPQAQKALTTETRGQNSWVNFGPKGVENRANPASTVYADQKAGLLPDWAMVPNPIKPAPTDPSDLLRINALLKQYENKEE